MKNHACKKFVCLLCAVLLLAAAVVPAYADDDSISVSSNPVTDGKTCGSCGLKSMVPTGATRTEKTQVYMTACSTEITESEFSDKGRGQKKKAGIVH